VTASDLRFEALLAYLREYRGFDFTGYKRASLIRRVDRRLAQLQIRDYGEYLDHLQVHPDEFESLFNTILINVTEFFRDAETWTHLRVEVLPMLLVGKGPSEPIRVWTAGCASGEEAYSLVITLCELLGEEGFRERVKIYATDVDEDALAQARQARYSAREIRNLPPNLINTYFERVGSHGRRGPQFAFRKDLRRSVIFGRNDLVQDAPISRIDLLVCRNVLMYFNAETQARILRRFHFALIPGGVLFLGKAELLLGHVGLFAPLDARRRVFRKAVANSARDLEGFPADGGLQLGRSTVAVNLWTEALLASPSPLIVVDAEGRVAVINRQAETTFRLTAQDIGRPFGDLELSHRLADLGECIERARMARCTVRVRDVDYVRGATVMHVELEVTPLTDRAGNGLGTSIVVQDVSEAYRLRLELEHTNRELETAYEELQSTVEELETTNEELQSTVEELETTNEELQSTNEELETMNEELQSANDELQTINDELRERTEQLNDANAFLASVLTGLRAGVAVLDRELCIQVWNRPAEDLWGLRGEEAVGQHFLNLEIGLAVDRLSAAVRQAVSTGEDFDLVMPAVNRFGRDVDVRVVGGGLHRDGDLRGAVLVMEAVAASGE
jgi:two-component system CheB/CheR fusion protein